MKFSPEFEAMLEGSERPELQRTSPDFGSSSHTIFLIHGIISHGDWQRTAQVSIDKQTGLRAEPIGYGFFDIVSFILPLPFLKRYAIRRVKRCIRYELEKKECEKISVIAHSFGTYIVSEIIKDEPDIKFDKLLFCGAVVKNNFPWEMYSGSFSDRESSEKSIVNCCGTRDVFPIIAHSAGWSYGPSGRHGMRHPAVKDVYFDMGHGGYFEDEFLENYMIPFVRDSKPIQSSHTGSKTNALLSLISIIKLRYFIAAGLLYICYRIATAVFRLFA